SPKLGKRFRQRSRSIRRGDECRGTVFDENSLQFLLPIAAEDDQTRRWDRLSCQSQTIGWGMRGELVVDLQCSCARPPAMGPQKSKNLPESPCRSASALR